MSKYEKQNQRKLNNREQYVGNKTHQRHRFNKIYEDGDREQIDQQKLRNRRKRNENNCSNRRARKSDLRRKTDLKNEAKLGDIGLGRRDGLK